MNKKNHTHTTCTECGFTCKRTYKLVRKYFGWRIDVGASVEQPQSRCKKCRSSYSRRKRQIENTVQFENESKYYILETERCDKCGGDSRHPRGTCYSIPHIPIIPSGPPIESDVAPGALNALTYEDCLNASIHFLLGEGWTQREAVAEHYRKAYPNDSCWKERSTNTMLKRLLNPRRKK